MFMSKRMPVYLVVLPRGLAGIWGGAFRYFRVVAEGWPGRALPQVRSRVLKDVLLAPVGRVLVCWILGFVCIQFL